MNKTIIGIFLDRSDVEEAIDKLKTEGFNPKDISIVMKDKREQEEVGESTGTNVAGGALSGAATGAVVGGIAGLLAGTVLPGLGGFLIGGPIGAALGLTGAAATTVSGAATGAVAGGLLGALMGLGLTKDEASHYEERVNQGAILVAVPCRSNEEGIVQDIFATYHAEDVKSVTSEPSRRHSTEEEESVSPEYTSESSPQMYAMGAKGGQSEGKGWHGDSEHHAVARRGKEPHHPTRKSRSTTHKTTGRKGGASHGKLANPIQVEKFLKRVDYPATRRELLKSAKEEGADETIISTLQQIPDKEYKSPVTVSKAIGDIE